MTLAGPFQPEAARDSVTSCAPAAEALVALSGGAGAAVGWCAGDLSAPARCPAASRALPATSRAAPAASRSPTSCMLRFGDPQTAPAFLLSLSLFPLKY